MGGAGTYLYQIKRGCAKIIEKILVGEKGIIVLQRILIKLAGPKLGATNIGLDNRILKNNSSARLKNAPGDIFNFDDD
ncbi:MAG: hypothetical protein GX996_08715 [Firmicutes bacterium]|jgi:hypothetical protein|nr:hypothetical protein [Bacillota bacterium]